MTEPLNTSGATMHFEKPTVQFNENGWGPCELSDTFKDVPYQPFSKSDRLGKICDWTNTSNNDKKYQNKYASTFGTGNQYAYYHEEDETTFHLVDTARKAETTSSTWSLPNSRGRNTRGGLSNAMTTLGGKNNKARDSRRGVNKKFGSRNAPPKIRESSVAVRADWTSIEEMDFPRLMKLSLPNIKEGEDIVTCGTLEYYDKTYDRINVKNEKPLQKIDRIVHTVTTIDDPVIRRLSKTVGNVFATDAILATIMCSTRSNYSWDIVIEKFAIKIFMDKRDNTEFDLLTATRTSVEPPTMMIVHPTHHTGPNESKYKFEEANPFITEDEDIEVASVGYRYKKWNLGSDIVLVARCEHDGVLQTPNNEPQFLSIKALNEWDSKLANGVEWRQKLDTQRGAVLANELRNNACKLAKWTVQAVLAGSDQLKLGYVSRINPRDPSRHVILGTQQFKPHEFATQINLSMDNAWGILRCIIDIVMKQKDGKYLIMKDPNKPMIRLYDIPDNTFDSDDSEDGDGDDGKVSKPVYGLRVGNK
ncbi:hypothetical protein DOY81_009064 [Sarcophaga bullata]|nr:hypothetical protein DOY81_009064 [Sarcophaga bullata]